MKGGKPHCVAMYHPTSGGTEASSVEAGDQPNVESPSGEYANPSEEGAYENPGGLENLTGPPLGSTEGGPTHSNY